MLLSYVKLSSTTECSCTPYDMVKYSDSRLVVQTCSELVFWSLTPPSSKILVPRSTVPGNFDANLSIPLVTVISIPLFTSHGLPHTIFVPQCAITLPKLSQTQTPPLHKVLLVKPLPIPSSFLLDPTLSIQRPPLGLSACLVLAPFTCDPRLLFTPPL